MLFSNPWYFSQFSLIFFWWYEQQWKYQELILAKRLFCVKHCSTHFIDIHSFILTKLLSPFDRRGNRDAENCVQWLAQLVGGKSGSIVCAHDTLSLLRAWEAWKVPRNKQNHSRSACLLPAFFSVCFNLPVCSLIFFLLQTSWLKLFSCH